MIQNATPPTRATSALVVSALAAVALVGCSSLETRVTQPEDGPTSMELLLEVPQSSSSGSVAPGPSANVVLSHGDVSMNLTGALLVMDQVEFRRQAGEGCIESDDLQQDDGDACAEAAVQPTPVELPVGEGDQSAGVVAVEPGTYEALEFDLYLVTESEIDILSRNSNLRGGSVLVQGSYDNTALDSAVFSPEGRVVLELDDPIDLGDGAAASMTLTVDVAAWFREADGSLVDPSAAARNPDASAAVSQRILDSFSIRAGS